MYNSAETHAWPLIINTVLTVCHKQLVTAHSADSHAMCSYHHYYCCLFVFVFHLHHLLLPYINLSLTSSYPFYIGRLRVICCPTGWRWSCATTESTKHSLAPSGQAPTMSVSWGATLCVSCRHTSPPPV